MAGRKPGRPRKIAGNSVKVSGYVSSGTKEKLDILGVNNSEFIREQCELVVEIRGRKENLLNEELTDLLKQRERIELRIKSIYRELTAIETKKEEEIQEIEREELDIQNLLDKMPDVYGLWRRTSVDKAAKRFIELMPRPASVESVKSFLLNTGGEPTAEQLREFVQGVN